jgi:hypothetical protein
MLEKARNIRTEFVDLSDEDKLVFIPSNNDIVKVTAKTCYNVLQLR